MKYILLLLMTITLSFASIGKITAINGSAYAVRGGSTVPLGLGSDIEKKDKIKTMDNTKLQIVFNDHTVISLGQKTEFKIDDYVFSKSKVKANFSVTKGIFKSITGKIGKIDHSKFKLKTKNATIGVRGTTFIGVVDDYKETIACTSGEIVVENDFGVVAVKRGEMTTVRGFEAPRIPKVLNKNFFQKVKSVKPSVSSDNIKIQAPIDSIKEAESKKVVKTLPVKKEIEPIVPDDMIESSLPIKSEIAVDIDKNDVKDSIKEDEVVNVFKSIITQDPQVEDTTTPVDSVTDATSDLVNDVTQTVSDTTTNVQDTVSSVIDKVEETTQTVVTTTPVDSVTDATSDVVNDVTQTVSDTTTNVQDTVSSVIDKVEETTQTVATTTPVDSVTDATSDLVNDVTQTVSDTTTNVQDTVSSVVDQVGDTTQTVTTTTPVDSVTDAASDVVNDVTQTVSDTTTNVQDTASNVVETTTEVINTTPTDSVVETTTEIVSGATDTVSGAVDSFLGGDTDSSDEVSTSVTQEDDEGGDFYSSDMSQEDESDNEVTATTDLDALKDKVGGVSTLHYEGKVSGANVVDDGNAVVLDVDLGEGSINGNIRFKQREQVMMMTSETDWDTDVQGSFTGGNNFSLNAVSDGYEGSGNVQLEGDQLQDATGSMNLKKVTSFMGQDRVSSEVDIDIDAHGGAVISAN